MTRTPDSARLAHYANRLSWWRGSGSWSPTTLGHVIDLQFLRTQAEQVRISQVRRGEDPDLVEKAVAADQAHREALTAFERMRAEQKDLGRQVAQATAEAASRTARPHEAAGRRRRTGRTAGPR